MAERTTDGARDIAIIATAQTPSYRNYTDSEPTLIMECVNSLLETHRSRAQ